MKIAIGVSGLDPVAGGEGKFDLRGLTWLQVFDLTALGGLQGHPLDIVIFCPQHMTGTPLDWRKVTIFPQCSQM